MVSQKRKKNSKNTTAQKPRALEDFFSADKLSSRSKMAATKRHGAEEERFPALMPPKPKEPAPREENRNAISPPELPGKRSRAEEKEPPGLAPQLEHEAMAQLEFPDGEERRQAPLASDWHSRYAAHPGGRQRGLSRTQEWRALNQQPEPLRGPRMRDRQTPKGPQRLPAIPASARSVNPRSQFHLSHPDPIRIILGTRIGSHTQLLYPMTTHPRDLK